MLYNWDIKLEKDIKIKSIIHDFDREINNFYKQETYNVLIESLTENNLSNINNKLLPIVQDSNNIKKKFYKNINFFYIDKNIHYFSINDMKKTISCLPTDRPIESFNRISSGFKKNWRYHPILKKKISHLGTDYAALLGTPIKAPLNGKIKYVGHRGRNGKSIIIQHEANITTRYYHLNKYSKNLKKGMIVNKNEIIGFVGNTGRSTGPHLHYEVSIFNNNIDSEKIILLKNLITKKILDN